MHKKILGLMLAFVMILGNVLPTITFAQELVDPEPQRQEEILEDIIPNIADESGNYPEAPGYVTLNFMVPNNTKKLAHLEGVTSYLVNPDAGLNYYDVFSVINLPQVVISKDTHALEEYASTG